MAPVNIESTLQEQAADRQCCEIGDGRDHLTALIVLEPALAARPDAAHEVARHEGQASHFPRALCPLAARSERPTLKGQLVPLELAASSIFWRISGASK